MATPIPARPRATRRGTSGTGTAGATGAGAGTTAGTAANSAARSTTHSATTQRVVVEVVIKQPATPRAPAAPRAPRAPRGPATPPPLIIPPAPAVSGTPPAPSFTMPAPVAPAPIAPPAPPATPPAAPTTKTPKWVWWVGSALLLVLLALVLFLIYRNIFPGNKATQPEQPPVVVAPQNVTPAPVADPRVAELENRLKKSDESVAERNSAAPAVATKTPTDQIPHLDNHNEIMILVNGGSPSAATTTPPAPAAPQVSEEQMLRLKDSISDLEKKVRDAELTKFQAENNARLNTENPGVNALRRKEILEMGLEIKKLNEQVSSLRAELEKLAPANKPTANSPSTDVPLETLIRQARENKAFCDRMVVESWDVANVRKVWQKRALDAQHELERLTGQSYVK